MIFDQLKQIAIFIFVILLKFGFAGWFPIDQAQEYFPACVW